MTLRKERVSVSGLIAVVLLCIAGSLSAQDAPPPPDEKALKYHQALLRRPSPDYLFERFYNSWLDSSSLDELEKFLNSRASDSEKSSTADRLLLAFFHSRQGNSGKAIAQLRAALESDKENADAWRLLAEAEASLLNFESALKSLDRALGTEPKPAAALRNEIRQLQGKLFARSGDRDRAMQIWKQLVTDNPGHDELREDLIDLQLREGLVEEATQSMKTLIDDTKDPYQSVLRSMQLGDMYQGAGNNEVAVATYAECLEKVGADSWIEREVFAQIERIYRRTDDLDALKKFYTERLEAGNPTIALLRHHAELQASMGNNDAAIEGFRKILAITPGDRPLREAFIDLLTSLGKHKVALEQLDALAAQTPGDAELILRKADLQNRAGDDEACQKLIADFLENSAGFEADHLRACRLLEQYHLKEAADKSYTVAVATFPQNPVVLEAHAAYLHKTKRKPEAIAIWKKLGAGGDSARAVKIARALASRREDRAAFDVLHARLEEFGDEPIFLALLCDQAMRVEKSIEAIPWSLKLVRLAELPGDLEQANARTLRIARLAEKSDELVVDLEHAAERRTPQESLLLVEAYSLRNDLERAEIILVALAKSHPLLTGIQRARLYEQRREWLRAALSLAEITELPGGRKSTHIRKIVELARRGGDDALALHWLPEWKKISPGSTLPWIAEARIHQESNSAEEAIHTLRLATQQFPDDSSLRAQLARIYKNRGQFPNAQRIYQRLYDESDDPQTKLQWISEMAKISERSESTDLLLERFQARRKNNRKSIAPLLALAEIHRVANDYENRRKMLFEASRLKPDDIALLHNIARIEAAENEFGAALKTLQSAAIIDKTSRSLERIVRLHFKAGDEDEAYRVIAQIAASDKVDARGAEQLAESMAESQNWEAVIEFLTPYVQKFPDDFRLAYFNTIALEETGETEAAVREFRSLAQRGTRAPPAVLPGNLIELRRTMPPDAIEILRYLTSSAKAYSHRLQVASASGLRGYQQQQLTNLVLPADLRSLADLSIAHLIQNAKAGSTEDIELTIAELRQLGVAEPELYFEIPHGTPAPPNTLLADLISQFPENLTLKALAIAGSISAGHVDLDQCLHGFKSFEKDFPQLAFAWAMLATDSTEPAAKELVEHGVRLAANIAQPSDKTVHYLKSVMCELNVDPFGGSLYFESLLTAEQNRLLAERLIAWTPQFQKNPHYVSRNFPSFAVCLAGGGTIGQLVEFLELEFENGDKSPQQESPGFAIQDPFGGMNSDLAAIEFPPVQLSGTPSHLLEFLRGPSLPNRINREGATGEKFSLELRKIENPILRICLLSSAGFGKVVAEEINSLEARGADLTVAERLLVAAHYSSTGKRQHALDLLTAFDGEAPDDETRQQIDASIIVWSQELAIADAEDNTPLIEAGRAAALRLGTTIINTQQRTAVAAILTNYGLEKEADELTVTRRQKVVTSQQSKTLLQRALSHSHTVQLRSSWPTIANPTEELTKLLATGRSDVAKRKLISRVRREIWSTLSTSGNSPTSSQIYVQYPAADDWPLVLAFARNNYLMDDVLEALDPGDSTNVRKHLEFAAAHELFARGKKIPELYKKVLELDPANQAAMMRLAPLIATESPDEALELLVKLRPAYLAQVGSRLNISNAPEKTAERASAVAKLVSKLLPRLKNPRAHRLGWVEASSLLATGEHRYFWRRNRIGSAHNEIYQTPDPPPELTAEEKTQRDALVAAMLDIPQLAETAFQRRAEQESSDQPSVQFAASAKKVLTTATKPRIRYNNGFPVTPGINQPTGTSPELVVAHRAWLDSDQASLESLVDELRAKGKRDAAENLDFIRTLYFENGLTFLTAAKQFARRRPNGFSSGNVEVLDTVIDIWKQRKLKLDLSEYLIEEIVATKKLDTTPYIDHAESLGQSGGFVAVDAFIDGIANALLGDEKKRATHFKKSMTSRGSLPIVSSGNNFQFYSPNVRPVLPAQPSYTPHQKFGIFLSSLLRKPATTFSALSAHDRYLKPYFDKIPTIFAFSSHQFPLSRPEQIGAPGEWLSMLHNAPFFCELESLRTFPLPAKSLGSGLGLLTYEIDQLPDEQKAPLVEFIRNQPPSFGRDLMLVSIEPAGRGSFKSLASPPTELDKTLDRIAARTRPYEFLAKYAERIEKLPHDQLRDIAALSFTLQTPGEGISPAAKALHKRFLAIRPGGEIDQRKEFLARHDWESSRLGQKILTLVPPVLAKDNRDTAHDIFRHAAKLWDIDPADPVGGGKSKPGSWADDIYKIYLSPDALAFSLELISANDKPQIELYHPYAVEEVFFKITGLLQSSHPTAGELLDAVKKFSAHVRRPETAMLLTAVPLSYLESATDTVRAEAVAALEAHGGIGIPLARAASLGGPTPDFDHYLDYFADETISLTARTAVYGILTDELREATPEKITRAGADLVARSWKKRAPVPHGIVHRMLPPFHRIPSHDAAWQATGTALADSWRIKRSGGDVAITSFVMDIALECGERSTVETMISTPRKDGIVPDASWVQILTKHHDLELAAKVINVHWKKFGFPGESGAFKYDDTFEQHVLELLPKIWSAEARYFAELILASSLDQRITDPIHARQERAARITAVAKRFPVDDIKYVPTRRRLLGMIANYPAAANTIPELYAETAKGISFDTYYTSGQVTRATDPEWYKNRVYLTHIRQRIANKSAATLSEYLELVEDRHPDDQPQEHQFEIASGAVLQTIQNHVQTNWPQLSKDELVGIAKHWRDFLGRHPQAVFRVAVGTDFDDEIQFDALEVFGFTVLVHALADDTKSLTDWRASPEGKAVIGYTNDAQDYNDPIVTDAMQNFSDAFKAPELDIKTRVALTKKLLSDPTVAALVKDPKQAAKLVKTYGLLKDEELPLLE